MDQRTALNSIRPYGLQEIPTTVLVGAVRSLCLRVAQKPSLVDWVWHPDPIHRRKR